MKQVLNRSGRLEIICDLDKSSCGGASGVKVIGVRSRENKRFGCTGSEYRQLCDVCSQKKKKAGGVILEGTMGQRRYTHTYRYI